MSKLKPRLSRCPSCQRKGMERNIMDVEVEGGKRIVPDVEVDVCPHCGEQLYDPPAMRTIEAALSFPRRRKPRVKV